MSSGLASGPGRELVRETEPNPIRSSGVGKDTAVQLPATAVTGQSGVGRDPPSVRPRSGSVEDPDIEGSIPGMAAMASGPTEAIGSAPMEAAIPSISRHVVDAHNPSA